MWFNTRYTVFIVCLILGVLQGCASFSTSEVFNLVLDVFGNTRFHDTQVAAALCITQYRYLVRNNGLTAREPDYYVSCPYSEWIDSVYDVANANWINARFRMYVSLPDLESALKANPSIHFDAESFIPGSNYHLIQSRTALFQSLKSNANIDSQIPSIQRALGVALHTLQDFYSHTNWVELGHTDINSRVGEDSSLGIALNGQANTACTPCTSNQMNAAEKATLDEVKKSFINDALLRLLGFSYDSVQVCRDNIVTNELTTGYYSNEAIVAPKPAGKCSHGGGTDQSDTHAPTGGINKDSETLLFSPHYYLHQQAANLSTKATIRYLDDLRIALNDEITFGKIIGLSKVNAYAFVVDVTASMQSSYNAILAYVKDVTTNAPSGSLFYVTWFGDPDIGPVRMFNASIYVNEYMMSLVPQNGADGPEQCYQAILKTANAVPPGTKIDVFTDAESKDGSLQQSIQNIATTKQLSVNFILDGIVKSTPSYRTSSTRRKRDVGDTVVAGFDMYKRMATATNGIYVFPEGIGNYTKLADATGIYNDWETIIFEENVNIGCPNGLRNWTIPIDDTISMIEVALTTDSDLLGGLMTVNTLFTDEKINRVHAYEATELLSSAEARLYHFNTKGKVADYLMHVIQKKCPSIDFTVNVRAQSYMRATVQLFTAERGTLINGPPLANELYSIAIDCPNCASITQIDILQCGQNVQNQQIPVVKVANMPMWRVQNVTMPSADLLCIVYKGTTKSGATFKRVHREKLSPTTFEVEMKIYSNDYPVDAKLHRNSTGYVEYKIVNRGLSDVFDVLITSQKLGNIQVPQARIFLETNAEYRNSVEFSRAADTDGSNFDTVHVNVVPNDNPYAGVVRSADYTIVKPVISVLPPFCNITLNNFDQNCQRHLGSANPFYNVEIVFGQSGSVITDVRSHHGLWTFGSSSGSGQLSCNEKIDVVIVDESGRVARCQSTSGTAATTVATALVLFLFSRVC